MTAVETASNLAVNSVRRLAALEATGLYNAPPQVSLDGITNVAVRTLAVPAVFITLIHREQQYILSSGGIELTGGVKHQPLSNSFCRNVVDGDQPMIIRNTADEPRVAGMPASKVIIAYAGLPIRSIDGHVFGAICAVDVQQREWSDLEVGQLSAFAAQASLEMQSLERGSDAQPHEPVNLNRFAVHDLRTPLSSTLMGLELVSRIGPLNDEQDRYLNLCRNSGTTLLEMIDQLLDISNVASRGSDVLALGPQRPCELIERAVGAVASLAAGKSIEVSATVTRTLPAVRADADKITRVLQNLLANAVKYTQPGGQIIVGAAIEKTAAGRVIRFTIRDNGVGIDPADAEAIFEEGYRSDPAQPTRAGTGLGLTFCRQIVRAHGGDIACQPATPQGSTFSFTLPTA